jgi:magnesium and cobalt transporter
MKSSSPNIDEKRNYSTQQNSPEVSGLRHLRQIFMRLLRLGKKEPSLQESMAELIDEHDPEGTHVRSEERAMINNVLQFGEQRAVDIMIPRTDIIAVADDAPLEEIRRSFVESGHTRLPVYRDSLDHIIGFLHIKDVFVFWDSSRNFVLQDVMRQTLFVPSSMRVLDLFARMRSGRVHIALVLDEYGGIDGLVTLEDLVEEIVGEIEDEHDEAESPHSLKKMSQNQWEMPARLPIQKLESALQISLATDDATFDTIGGLLCALLGSVPPAGTIVDHPAGVRFDVLDADSRRIKRVRATIKANNP